MKPGNAAELIALPDVDGALVGRGQPRSRATSPRSWKRPPDAPSARAGEPAGALARAGDPRRLRPGAGRPRERRLPGQHADLRRALGLLSAHDPLRPPAATSGCPTARWATPRSATSTSAPARSSSRTWRGSTTRSPTAASSRTRRCAPPAAPRASPARGRLHAIGLISDGGVHSGWEHIEAIIELAGEEGVTDLVIHALTDGRDTLPHNGAGYVEEVERWLRRTGRIGTVGGRYWGMDRDRRWDRTKKAYDAIVHAQGAARRLGRRGDQGLLRAGRHRRVHRADRDRRLRRRRGRRAVHLHQLPSRPGPPDDPGARRAGLRRVRPRRRRALRGDDDDRVPPRLALPGRLPAEGARDHARPGDLRAGRAPAARRRDREVRARHLLLRRGQGGGAAGRGAAASPSRRATSRPTTTSPR